MQIYANKITIVLRQNFFYTSLFLHNELFYREIKFASEFVHKTEIKKLVSNYFSAI